MKRIRIKNVTTSGETKKEITMPSSMYMAVYEAVSGQKFEKDELVEDLAKVDGVTLENSKEFKGDNGKIYEYQISSPSQMRDSVCLFRDKEKGKFFDTTEDILCGGKYKHIELATDSYLKDLLARLALGLTGGEMLDYPVNITEEVDNDKINIIIVKDIEISTKKLVKTIKDDESGFDYSPEEVEITTDAFDGAGIMTKGVAKIIQAQFKMEYTPAWITYRSFMWQKGLLTTVDIEGYMDRYHNGKRSIVDYIGKERIITPLTIIVPESCVKGAKWFDGISDYDKSMKNSGYEKYQAITDKIWIVKKANKKSKEMAETSYQMLNLLKISKQEYAELASSNENFLKEVRKKDESACLEFTGLTVKPLSNVEDEEYEIQSKDDKLFKMFAHNFKDMIQIPTNQKALEDNIFRKTQNHLAGKFLLEDSSFKIIAPDAILFMNYIAKQEVKEFYPNGKIEFKITNLNQVAGGLAPRTWYVRGDEGKVFTGRYPMAGFFELSNEQLVQSKLHDRYCLYNNEIITVNQRGTELMEKSGADCDGDLLFVSKNKILMDSVITPDRMFLNKNEVVKAQSLTYSDKGREARKRANLQLSKNYIGALAIGSSTLGDYCQSLTFWDNGKEYTLAQMKERYDNNMEIISKTPYLGYQSKDCQKAHIENRMKANELKFCIGVTWQMLVIDAPKKSYVIDEEAINEFLKTVNNGGQRPQFFPLLKDKETSVVGDVYSVMSDYYLNNSYLLFKPERVNKDEGCQVMKNLFFNAQFGSFNEDDVVKISGEIANMYRDYQTESHKIFVEFTKAIEEASAINSWYGAFSEAEEIKNDKYDKLSIKHNDKAIELYNNYSKDSICEAVRRWLERTSNTYYSKYIIDFYFYAVEALMALKPTISVLEKSKEGKINLFTPYVIKEIDAPKDFYNDSIVKVQTQRVERALSQGFNGKYTGTVKLAHNSTIIITQELTKIKVYQWQGNQKGTLIGEIYNNQINKVKDFFDIPIVIESFTNGDDKKGNKDVNFLQVVVRKI